MRVNCKFYESRTYASGDTVRMCRLDLAPEAPWRCPEDCSKFERKLVDGGWVHGSLLATPTPDEPAGLDDDAVRLLDEAENLINQVGPEILSEVQAQRKSESESPRRRRWWPFGRR